MRRQKIQRPRFQKLICHLLVFAQLFWISACTRDSVSGSGPKGGNISSLIAQINVGEEVYKVMRAQVMTDTDQSRRSARLTAMDARKDAFVEAVNTIINDKTLPGVESTIDVLFRLVDDGTIPALTDELRLVLLELINEPGQPTLNAVVSLLQSQSQVPMGDLVALLGRLVNYPDSENLWNSIGSLFAEYDGIDLQGQPNSEPPLVLDLLDIFSRRLKAVPDNPAAPSSSLALAFEDFKDALLEQAQGTATQNFGAAEWSVRLDDRGAPVVLRNAQNQLPSPFVDLNNDGLADQNSSGQFVDSNNQEIDLPPFGKALDPGYDAFGRAVHASGQPVYETFDSKKTLLALFLSNIGRLLAEQRETDIAIVLESALGPKNNQRFGQDNNLTRLLYGLLEMVKYDESPKFLRAMSVLLNQNPDQAEEVLLAVGRAFDALKNRPSNGAGLRLSDPKIRNLVDSLLPALDEVFESNGNANSTARLLINTLSDLRTNSPDWPAQFAPLFVFKDVQRESSPDADRNSIDESASTAVDRSLPAGTDNRSAIHQLLDLLARANGCSFLGQNLAVMILDIMAGLNPGTVGTLISILLAVPGLANVACPGISNDLNALDALAQAGALDALLPIAKVFKDRNQTPLLVAILVRLQQDYASVIRPIEEEVSTVLESGALEELSSTLDTARNTNDPVSGQNIADILADGLANLVDDDQAVLDPSGQLVPSLAKLILDPLFDIDASLQLTGQGDALGRIIDSLIKAFLERTVVNNQEQLSNKSFVPFLARVLQILSQRLPTNSATRRQDVSTTQNDLRTAIHDPDAAKLFVIARTIVFSPHGAAIMSSIANMFTPNQNSSDDIFGAVTKLLALGLQKKLSVGSLPPVLRFLGKVLDPQRSLVPVAIRTIERFVVLDTSGSLIKVLRAALNPPPSGGEAPALIILDIFEDIQSAGNSSSGSLTLAQLTDLVQATADFMNDSQNGLPLFYQAIRNRRR